MSELKKASAGFWVIGIIALIWNGLGVAAYFQQMFMSAEDFAALPELQRNLLSSQPFWVTAAFAVAVFAGFFAAIMLLLRKRLAVRLSLLSLIAVIIQFSSYLILDGYLEFIGTQGWIMPLTIPLFAIGFLLIARQFEKAGALS
ncbi:hypothetical protein SAMN02745824_2261 [Parasphingorhabdus marina DSM 22363]|uniref:Sugar transporter n=1 Tax=Parasphingorhabdus marina DSM 22363 TaxID=1123272 RepID=A0A1N6F6L6_9SPHN|nr:hypothetical protein [Parasphingorhabdus marina]SIN90948.1 hypothetical protein SAMN02745824_2261 [Parasphingorhabdus marina DSM 22363]